MKLIHIHVNRNICLPYQHRRSAIIKLRRVVVLNPKRPHGSPQSKSHPQVFQYPQLVPRIVLQYRQVPDGVAFSD